MIEPEINNYSVSITTRSNINDEPLPQPNSEISPPTDGPSQLLNDEPSQPPNNGLSTTSSNIIEPIIQPKIIPPTINGPSQLPSSPSTTSSNVIEPIIQPGQVATIVNQINQNINNQNTTP